MTDSATHPYAFVTIKHALQSSIGCDKRIINSDDLVYDDEFPTSIAPSNASCSSSSAGSSLGASTSMISLADSVDSSNDSSELSHDDTDDGYNTPDDDDVRRINVDKFKSVPQSDSIIDFPTPVIASGGLDAGLDAECIFMTGSSDYHDHTGANLGTKSAIAKLLAESATATSIVNVSNEIAKSADITEPEPRVDDDKLVKSHVATPVTAIAKPAPAVVAPAAEPAVASRLINTTKYATTKKQTSGQPLGKHRFNVGTRYRVCDVIGEGAYGVVCSAVHRSSGQKVAIKKIQPFEHQMFALRTMRELKLLRFFQEMDVCENIISILDVVKAPTYEQFNEVYFIQELMETDLHRVVRSQKLSDDHAQYFVYQILRALKVMHSADVIHRDLKPSNVLLNANCDLKVCDFGLARSLLTAEPGGETGFMTEYVATRWYRAPEIMLTFKQYTKAIDVWAVGCILAEMITGRPLFPGRDYHHQISLILDVLGTPSIDDWYAIGSRRSRDYIRQMPLRKRKDFSKLFPTASPDALDFLQKTLAFNPKKRPTVEECLAHPYLAAYHDPEDEPSVHSLAPEYFSYDLQPRPSAQELRREMWDEIESLPRYI